MYIYKSTLLIQKVDKFRFQIGAVISLLHNIEFILVDPPLNGPNFLFHQKYFFKPKSSYFNQSLTYTYHHSQNIRFPDFSRK